MGTHPHKQSIHMLFSIDLFHDTLVDMRRSNNKPAETFPLGGGGALLHFRLSWLSKRVRNTSPKALTIDQGKLQRVNASMGSRQKQNRSSEVGNSTVSLTKARSDLEYHQASRVYNLFPWSHRLSGTFDLCSLNPAGQGRAGKARAG